MPDDNQSIFLQLFHLLCLQRAVLQDLQSELMYVV